MYRREFLILTCVVAAVFSGVAGLGWLAVKQLRDSSTMLVMDTLPGLADSGMAAERMRDNRFAMRRMLLSHSAGERAQLIHQVQTNSTDALWRDYIDSIYEAEDRRNYQALVAARKEYLICCQHFYNLISAGKDEEASAYFDGELSVKFRQYDGLAKTIFDYNVRQGKDRGKKILKTARYAPLAVAGLTVLVFVFGLILGLRSSLSGLTSPFSPRRRV